MEIRTLTPSQPEKPHAVQDWFKPMNYIGNPEILQKPLLAIFSSVQCPAALILKAHDTARQLSAKGQAVISGFQSPVEKEMLTVLLRGQSPIVICPARGLEGMRIPAGWKPGLEAGRLLLLSPFPADLRRVTAEQAERRNRLVFSLAEHALIVHAAPGGKLEQLCQEVSAAGVNLFTYDSVYNQNILSLGAQIWAI